MNLEYLKIKLDKEPKKELRLFALGKNKTEKGDFYLDGDSVDSILSKQKDVGNLYSFDYDHGMISGQNGVSAGSFVLDKKEDGIYATNIDWTEKASNHILNKEYLYISPAFVTVTKSNKKFIKEIVNCALTNIPATHNATTLLSKESQMELELLKKELAESKTKVESLGLDVIQLKKQTEIKDMDLIALKKQVETKDAELIALKAQAEKIKFDACFEKGVSLGKLVPSDKEKIVQLCDTSDKLEIYLSIQPTKIKTAPSEQEDATKSEILSDVEKHICQLTGISEEQFLKTKKGGK